MNITRRKLFGMAAAAGFASRLARPDDTDPTRMIVRSLSPTDLEMPLQGFNEAITPIDRFFVRCHTLTPKVDAKTWNLKIDGLVSRPLTLTMADLRKMPRFELVAVLECAGNGRTFYEPHVPGTQWAFGSVGNGRWTGVRLKDVLEKAGIKDSATELLLDGADTPLGSMDDFRRTVTVKKALDPDTMLAYEMNGQPLPTQHGFPLRLIAPGWAGDSWVKWLTHIEVLDHEFDGFWMKTAYRHPPGHVAPGTAVDAAQMIPVTDLNVKSVIATPASGPLLTASAKISGAAWSNSSPVAGVDVSTDGGKTWTAATLSKDLGRYSWRNWELSWTPPGTGEYVLMSRARNAAGTVQPMEQEWNPSGYLWNVSQPVKVQVDYPAGYKGACMPCHDEHMMMQQHLTRTQWEREVDKMVRWGAQVKPEDREGILSYLAGRYKQ
ncbi:MAG TPA: sulfite oxidase [Bryobacteraceae bacterium]|nr:sulfite oxidase [Bryobacteraceae bacterium]